MGKEYSNGRSDSLDNTEYIQWTRQWIDECIRVLVPGGSLFIYNIPKWLLSVVAPSPHTPTQVAKNRLWRCAATASFLVGNYLLEQMTFRHWIAIMMKNSYPRGNSLYPAHYGLLYFTKGEARVFNKLRVPIPTCRHCGKEIKDYGGHRDKLHKDGLNLTDFWDDTSPVRHRKFKTRVANELKPMIPERALLMTTNHGDIVLDPFGGGGSTYQVAEPNERLWIGTEIGPCEPIIERIQFQPKIKIGETPPSTILSCFK